MGDILQRIRKNYLLYPITALKGGARNMFNGLGNCNDLLSSIFFLVKYEFITIIVFSFFYFFALFFCFLFRTFKISLNIGSAIRTKLPFCGEHFMATWTLNLPFLSTRWTKKRIRGNHLSTKITYSVILIMLIVIFRSSNFVKYFIN